MRRTMIFVCGRGEKKKTPMSPKRTGLHDQHASRTRDTLTTLAAKAVHVLGPSERGVAYRCVSNRARNESFCGGRYSQCELCTVAAPVLRAASGYITHIFIILYYTCSDFD